MAVTITKKFWDGSAHKDIAKVVFTSPNFTSPAPAGTRSHMPPGGQYMGTWYESVDQIYRQKPNQDYADFPNEMESFFGKMTVSGTFDFANDSNITVYHQYGDGFDVVGSGSNSNVLYFDKDNYGLVSSSTSSSGNVAGLGYVTVCDITLGSTVGDAVINDWETSTVSGSVFTTISGFSTGPGNPIDFDVEDVVIGVANNRIGTTVTGTVNGVVSGLVVNSGPGTASGTVSGTLSGTLSYEYNDKTFNSYTTGLVTGEFAGPEYGDLLGTVSGTVSGTLESKYELTHLQTSGRPVNSANTDPRPRRHHGENSVIFSVTFGEAYDCRLTAWDDDTHSTTDNKVLAEEHYKVDVVAYRSNIVDTPHMPTFNNTNNMVFPAAYDKVLKGNEKYYGDFDLIFAIETDQYGEYLAFIPRLINMDDSFTAGSYDFVTTLHYEYT